jgi:hypothetical protein
MAKIKSSTFRHMGMVFFMIKVKISYVIDIDSKFKKRARHNLRRDVRAHRDFTISNRNIGKVENRLVRISGTHEHRFENNSVIDENKLMTGNMNIATLPMRKIDGFLDLIQYAKENINILDLNLIKEPIYQLGLEL